MDYRFNAFKKHLNYFFDRENVYERDVESTLIYNYVNFINNNYVNPYSLNSFERQDIMKDILLKNPNITVDDAMYAAIISTQACMNSLMSIQKKTIDDYENDLFLCQKKNRNLKEFFINKTKKLEDRLNDAPNYSVLSKMHLAFKAGQDSMEAKMFDNKLKAVKKYTFKYWANQIWKYGKAKLAMPATCSHPIVEEKQIKEDIAWAKPRKVGVQNGVAKKRAFQIAEDKVRKHLENFIFNPAPNFLAVPDDAQIGIDKVNL